MCENLGQPTVLLLFRKKGLISATLVLLFLLLAPPSGAQSTVKLSGTITDQDTSPVPGVAVNLNWFTGGAELVTDAAGKYSQSGLPAGSGVNIHIRPPVALRLADRNTSIRSLTGDTIKDFVLERGHLLQGKLVLPGSMAFEGGAWMSVLGLNRTPPEGEWLGNPIELKDGRFEMVLPPDIYEVSPNILPDGCYVPRAAVDLRTADVTDLIVQLTTEWRHPLDFDPPDVGRLRIGIPDDLGEVTITGDPGSVLPLARVLVVNLSCARQAYTESDEDGSFTTRIFAPPGSSLLVKHGRAGYWTGIENGISWGPALLPGAILTVPHQHSAKGRLTPFSAVGAFDVKVGDNPDVRGYVGTTWMLNGSAGPVVVEGEWNRVLAGSYEGTTRPDLYLGGLNMTHPALGDLDGDGDLDLLVGERGGRLVLYRNLGNIYAPQWTFESQAYARIDVGDWAYPALGDLNGDGVLDLVVGTGSFGLHVYYNQGTRTAAVWPDEPDVTLAGNWHATAALADLDGDGDLDLLAGGFGQSLSLFRNNTVAGAPSWNLVTNSYANIKFAGQESLQPCFVDLDNDKDLDLLLGVGAQLHWYRNNGPKTAPSWTLVTDDFLVWRGSSYVSPTAADWDNDGDPDIVTGEHWGVLRFLRNDGVDTFTEEFPLFQFDLNGDTAPAVADWDGDGDYDLLLGQAHGNVHRFVNEGDKFQPDWRTEGVLLTLPWTNHPHPFPTFADIDGDGDQDLFIGEGDWEDPLAGGNIRHYRNDGNKYGPQWNLVTEQFLGLDVGGWSTPVFVDIDADQDLDLFIGSEAGTLTFVKNTGTVTSPAWAAPVSNYAAIDVGERSAPAFLDVDGDGDLDMLIGSAGGSLAYVRNTGSATSPSWDLVSVEYPGIDAGENSTPVAADMNGDGKKDLLIGDGDGGLNLFVYLGPGTPPPSSSLAPGDLFQIQAEMSLFNPAFSAQTDLDTISVGGIVRLLMSFDEEGRNVPAQNYFMSNRLTSTGFPIQHQGLPALDLPGQVLVTDLHYVRDSLLKGTIRFSGRLPADLPDGVYRPEISFWPQGLPVRDDWVAAYVVSNGILPHEALLPPLRVGNPAPPRLIWRLLMEDFSLGLRGTGAREDRGAFELTSQIVSQGAPYVIPPVDVFTGKPIRYRLEPYLPTISWTDRRLPGPPLIPFEIPGGKLHVSVILPDGSKRDLGQAALRQSDCRSRTNRGGQELNGGTVQLQDVYSLTTGDDQFRFQFSQFGHHVITMEGTLTDIWGNVYEGGGTYDLWVAYPLDIDPGVLPGTPLAKGDRFNPAVRLSPAVPANVEMRVTLCPGSEPGQASVQTVAGRANAYGEFAEPGTPVVLSEPGEYRVDLVATYRNRAGEMYMGAATWGGVVMTPAANNQLVAHGRRGVDSLSYIPNHWFVSGRDLNIVPGTVSHTLNPYYGGDIAWTRMSDNPVGGDALVMGASVQDTVGAIEAAVRARLDRQWVPLSGPGQPAERFDKAEIPLFSCTRDQRPTQLPGSRMEQIAYSYRTSQRPGERVREMIAEDSQSGGYWRLNTQYDEQPGVGVQGDLPNDFKFQYVGVVYRDLMTGHKEYLGQGTGWVFLPDDDPLGSRVMPPFAGPGNGGWTTEGGPLLRLKGKDVHIFIHPTGTRPGAVLETGDTFRFGGHIMPTLGSQVEFTATAPSGALYRGGGKANSVGYYYCPEDDFTVSEPGLWSVDVRVWHNGTCSGGKTVPPFPSGDVLGSEGGRFWFYVVPVGSLRLNVSAPLRDRLANRDPFSLTVLPVLFSGVIDSGIENATVDYTICMPGFILERGQAQVTSAGYSLVFDPARLAKDYPNLDLMGRDVFGVPGLADTFTITLFLTGKTGEGPIFQANNVTIQGEQVQYENDRRSRSLRSRRSR